MTGEAGRAVPCIAGHAVVLAVHVALVVIVAIDTGKLNITGGILMTFRTLAPCAIVLA